MELITNCDRFKKLKHSSAFPRAFTEHGALMLSVVLKSTIAVKMSIQIVRAFSKMRLLLTQNEGLAKELIDIKRKLSEHDENLEHIFQVLNKLILPTQTNRKKVGFV